MSERRQFALLLAGLVVLVAIGIVGASLFPERCEGLERTGELDLVFADAAVALPVEADVAASLEGLGQEIGIGPWRGAVALPDDAQLFPSEFGFFVVTEESYTVLRPSIGVVSAARGREGLDVIPAGTSLGLRAEDGETGVFNGEYELDRCGELPPDGEVLAIDRGFALVVDGPEVVLVTLSGQEEWLAPVADAAHFSGDQVALGGESLLQLRAVRDGEFLDDVVDLPVESSPPWLDAVGDRLLLPVDGGVTPVTISDAGLEVEATIPIQLGGDAPTSAVLTPGGVVASGVATVPGGSDVETPAVTTDRTADPFSVPLEVGVLGLHASADGHVGLLVEVDGVRAVLVYGRDA